MTFSWLAIWQGLPYLLQGAGLTILISGVAMLLALLLGMVVALLSQLPWRLAHGLVRAYVEAFRNTPLLIQIFIVYFGLPQLGLKFSAFLSGLSALTLYTAAYNTEIFRAGLEAVPKGQHEAARSTGLSVLQEAIYVIIPQALRISFPALGNNLVSLVKNSSLVSTIGMVELMFVANDISFNNFRSFEIYGAAAVLYVILVLGLTRALNLTEARILRRGVSPLSHSAVLE
ncbi:MAG TPA: amino acid ABC transporter permease [Candidatus Acidoferrum sp.]|nr:amino acid ABC transporter permease [Candidatus Acidoferrum sp.]